MRMLCIRADETGVLWQLLGRGFEGLPVNWNHKTHRGALGCLGCEWLTLKLLVTTGNVELGRLKATTVGLAQTLLDGTNLRHQA